MKKTLMRMMPALAALCLAGGCGYRCATALPGELRQGGIALGEVRNLSRESILVAQVKDAFRTEMGKAPGMRLLGAGEADYLLDLCIRSMRTSSVVSAEVREDVSHDNDDTAYQSILHRADLELAYFLYRKAEPGKVLMSGTVEGEALMPTMHDREVMLRSANRKAAADAARRVVNAITENW